MQVIKSKENDIIKNIKKLKDKKYREKESKYIIEGIKLMQEAVEENAEINTVVICEDCINDGTIEQKLLYEIAKYNCVYVSEKVFNYITDVQNPQGILAVISKEKSENDISYDEDFILILDGVQDPGNIGTILRTADSVGLKQIIVSKGCGDVYNPKVVRSTMGAIFRLNIIEVEDLSETIKNLKKHKYRVMATALKEDSKSIYDVDFKKVALVIGNEANGVSKEVIDVSDEKVIIPMLRKNRKFKCLCCNRCNIV